MNDIKKTCFDYFSGDITPDVAKAISDFLKEDKSNEILFRDWEKEWSRDNIPTFSQIKQYNVIADKIHSRKAKRALNWAWRSAAVVAACAVLLFATPLGSLIHETQHFVVETSYCEHTKVTLPDSTQVWLNAASSLSYDRRSFERDRIVTLDGEAYFDVTHKEGFPFIVKMGESSIKVLGTKFNVSSYSHESVCEASLLEGSIEFSTPGTTVLMKPGEMLSYNTNNGTLVKTQCNVNKEISWMDNRLDYDSVTLKQLLTRLTSIYGVDITYYPRRLAKHTFCVNLSLAETMPNILDGLCLILPINWMYGDDGEFVVVETIN